MLSINALGGGDQNYYLSLVNINYYTEGGEPPGVWYGLAAPEFGLAGTVEKEHLERLCNGFHHLTEEKLVQNAGIFQGPKARKPADDLTFSADKTVSAIWAVTTDLDLKKAMEEKFDRAVKRALDLAQDKAAFARVGKNGVELVPAPLLFSIFPHSTSRAEDPQIHRHVLCLNLTVLENGKTRTIDSTHFYHWKMALGAVFRAELARGMQELGFDVERYEQGASVFFRVRGVPEALCEFWSKRRAEIEEKLKLELGSLEAATAKTAEIANLDTRRKKGDERPRCELEARWQEEGRTYGLTQESIQGLRRPYQAPSPEIRETEKEAVWREALAKLSYHQAYWSEAEMTKMVAERAAGRLSARDVRELIAHKIRSTELVLKGELITREKNAHNNQYLDRVDGQFTTPQILALEKALLDRAERMRQWAPHAAPKTIIREVFKEYPTIEPEQKRAVEYLTSGGPIRLMSGIAGTGKGYVLEACRKVWEREGREVLGIADAGATAKRLERDTGITSNTMAMTLIRLNSGKLQLSERTTMVVDEAGMLGTAPFAKLLEHAEKARARVVFAGDSFQLQPVQAGAPFKYLARMLKRDGDPGEVQLENIRRQNERWARDAVKDMRLGRSEEALQKYIEHNQLVLTDTRREAMQAIINQWVEDGGVTTPERVLMLAGLNHEVRELNLLAQAARIRAGLVDPEQKIFANKVFFHRGDKLQFTKPSGPLDVQNSDVGTVLRVDAVRQHLTVKLDKDGREVTVNLKRYSGENLRLAYAQTVHKSQGATVPHCHVLLGGPMTDLHLGYVQMSRSKESTFLFLNKQDAGPELRDIIRSLAKVRQKKLAHEVFHPAAGVGRSRPEEKEPRTPKPPTVEPRHFPDMAREEQQRQRRVRGISMGL